MTTDQLRKKLDELAQEMKNRKRIIVQQYCDSRNPYVLGDTFTDHIGSIQIQSIGYTMGLRPSHEDACCIYEGLILKADGQPTKKGLTRKAWQSNERQNPINKRKLTAKKKTIQFSSKKNTR